MRNVQKALLFALLQPHETMKAMQNENRMTELMALKEEMKTMPFGDVWEEFLKEENIEKDYISLVLDYERKVLVNR